MSELPKANYRFSVIPTNSPVALFTEIEQSPKISFWNHKRHQIAKQSGERIIKLEASHSLISNYITKHKNRYLDQWNKIAQKLTHTYMIN